MIIEKTAISFNVDIHMAGDIQRAGQLLQSLCIVKGMCVSLTPQSFIYTGGREEGFKVGFINYPRFPCSPDEIVDTAKFVAEFLMGDLGQHSYSIVTPVETIWRSRRPESNAVSADLLAVAEQMAALEDVDGMRFPTRAETAAARAAIEKAKAEGERDSPSDRSAPSIGSTPRIDRTSDGARE
jgi:hypothetical protein